MKDKILYIIVCFLLFISCKAQQNYPLNTIIGDIPSGSYIVDYDNDLDQYAGNYYAEFQGRKINLTITKEIKKQIVLDKESYYKDLLWIRYKVTDLLGNVLQSTFENFDIKNKGIFDLYLDKVKSRLEFYYFGTNCGIGWGTIEIKKISPTQLSWSYYPNSSVIDSEKCPPGQDLTVYLPETTGLIFTKQ